MTLALLVLVSKFLCFNAVYNKEAGAGYAASIGSWSTTHINHVPQRQNAETNETIITTSVL